MLRAQTRATVQTHALNTIARARPLPLARSGGVTGPLLNHTKEHCLVGLKGTLSDQFNRCAGAARPPGAAAPSRLERLELPG